MKYEAIEPVTHEQAEEVASSSDVRALANVLVAVALYDDDCEWTVSFCLRHVSHPDTSVRGCAMTGLGHLSRRFHGFREPLAVAEALKAGLTDPERFVRGSADDAADDFEQFAGGRVR